LKIIALGSKNPSKIRAAEMACKLLFGEFRVIPVEVEGTPIQPLSEEEMIEGAIYRAMSAMKKVPEAHYALGLEGGLKKNRYGTFVTGWVAVTDGKVVGLASTVSVQLPDYMWDLIVKGEVRELEEIMIKATGIERIGDTIGAIGFIALEKYDRARAFRDAILCAFGRIFRREVFEKDLSRS